LLSHIPMLCSMFAWSAMVHWTIPTSKRQLTNALKLYIQMTRTIRRGLEKGKELDPEVWWDWFLLMLGVPKIEFMHIRTIAWPVALKMRLLILGILFIWFIIDLQWDHKIEKIIVIIEFSFIKSKDIRKGTRYSIELFKPSIVVIQTIYF
jgi:hypothetical protein